MYEYIIITIITIGIIIYIIYNKKEKFDASYQDMVNEWKHDNEFKNDDFIKKRYDGDYDDLYNVVDFLRSEKDFNETKQNVEAHVLAKYDLNMINTALNQINKLILTENNGNIVPEIKGINVPQTEELPYEQHLKKLGVKLPTLYKKIAKEDKIKLIRILSGHEEKTNDEIRYIYNLIVKKDNVDTYANIVIKIIKDMKTKDERIESVVINGYITENIGRNEFIELTKNANINEIVNKFDKYDNKKRKRVFNIK